MIKIMKMSNTSCLSINCDIQPIQDYNLEFNPILHAIRACECVIICIKLTSTVLIYIDGDWLIEKKA